MSESEDFKLVRDTLLDFLKKKEIKERFSHILINEYNDWEKWFQIEFEYFLLNTKDFRTRREFKAISDRRSKLNRFYMFVDMIFRKPNTARDQYIYLEFKRAKKATTLVNGMLADITKVNSIVQSHYAETEIKQRSFWCIGFYESLHPLTVNRAKEAIKAYTKTFHEEIYFCSCRGAKHHTDCPRMGVVII